MDATKLLAYLPFDESPTEDLCGGSWAAHNNPIIQNCQLNFNASEQYVSCDDEITLGGQDFTICCKVNMNTLSGNYATVFALFNSMESNQNKIGIERDNTSTTKFYFACMGNTTTFDFALNYTRHLEIDYLHSLNKILVFVDGKQKGTRNVTINEMTFANCWLGKSNYSSDGDFVGTIDEFQIFDGVALHSEDFTPPDDSDYADIKLESGQKPRLICDFDTQRRVFNAAKGWRYHNLGTADLLATGGTTVNVDKSKSATGVAFYGGSLNDMFNVPEGLKEVWMRFDWWITASSTGVNFKVGAWHSKGNYATINTTGALWGDSIRIQLLGNIIGYMPDNSLTTCLLHIKSHTTDGVVEFDGGGMHYKFTGNVLDGNDLTDLFIYSGSGSTCLFSNVVVSETEITTDIGFQNLDFAVDTKILAPVLNVRRRGETVKLPFKSAPSEVKNAVAVRYAGKNFYNPRVAVNNAKASDVKFTVDDSNFALSSSL